MAQIAGVETIRNEDGRIDKITIDAQQHPQAVEALKGLGLIEKSPLRQELEANPENFRTVDEVFDELRETIKSWKWPK